ncbi:MAG TPA: hypothetical protein VEA15_07935 [Caulobacteraceae bacterium]|nr:hypothetical protein [Caulobacteraceae bacterium]
MATQNAVLPTGARAVAPSDTARLNACGLYVGQAGDLAVIPADQEHALQPQAVTFANCPAGFLLPVQVIRVMATGTTAGQLVALR